MHRYFVCYFLVQVIMQIIITSNKLYMPWKKILIFVCLLVIQLFVCTQYLEDFLVYVLHDLEGYIWFNNLRRTLLYFYCDQFFFLYSSSLHMSLWRNRSIRMFSTTFISKVNLIQPSFSKQNESCSLLMKNVLKKRKWELQEGTFCFSKQNEIRR